MIDKPLSDVTKDDLERLLTIGIPESRSIEYKRELPAKGEDGKREFLADVSSFANAAGGDLVFGVVEAESKPESIPGLAGINADQEIQRLENLLRDGIAPRIRGLQVKAIEGFDAGPAIVVRIPRSWAGPHMIKGSPRFYSRNSNGKAPLDVTEIRAAFLHSQGLTDRVREFRDDRIGRILAGETPVPLYSAELLVLHVIPMSLWAAGEQIDISAFFNQTYYLPTVANGGSPRPNLDGFLTICQGRDERKASGYAQLFRNGAIETLTGLGLNRHEDGISSIASEWFEKQVIQGIQGFVRLFFQMKTEGEFVVFLTLLGVRNAFLNTGSGQRVFETPERDNLLFPELVIPNTDVTVSRVAKPLLDLVWQAFGFEGSLNYYKTGEWRHEGRR